MTEEKRKAHVDALKRELAGAEARLAGATKEKLDELAAEARTHIEEIRAELAAHGHKVKGDATKPSDRAAKR